jgi:hypothetical protein
MGSFLATALFSMYLTPKAVGNAELTVGGIDSTKFIGRLLLSADSACEEHGR